MALELDKVTEELNAQTAAAESAGRDDENAVIQSATSALLSGLRLYLAHAEMQNAVGRLFSSLGVELSPAIDISTADVPALAKAFEQSFETWAERLNQKTGPDK